MGAVIGILSKSWGSWSGGNREGGRRGPEVNQQESRWHSSFCPNFSPSVCAQQPGPFYPAAPSSGCGPAFPCRPHPALPGLLVAHLQPASLLEGQLPVPTKCSAWLFSFSMLLPSPTAPLAPFGVPAPLTPKQDFVFSCQLVSKLGPLGVLLFLKHSSCAFHWPTQLFSSSATEVMSFVTIDRK